MGADFLPADFLPGRRTVDANRLSFALLEMGPRDGPLALCLHGYPDTAFTWRYLLPVLADAGWHAVAPFMRGYAPTAVPPDGVYQVAALSGDANALHDVLGASADAVLIGHDWGAAAGYGAAAHAPDRWRALITLAVPPAPVLAGGFTSLDQLKRSWYMFFQLTPLAEHVVPREGFAYLRALWEDWSPGYDAAEDVVRVAEALAERAHLLAALGYYRAVFAQAPSDPALADLSAALMRAPPQPTLYMHGRDDGCIGVELAGAVLDYLAPGSSCAVLDHAGHFLHLERPAEVNRRVMDFLA